MVETRKTALAALCVWGIAGNCAFADDGSEDSALSVRGALYPTDVVAPIVLAPAQAVKSAPEVGATPIVVTTDLAADHPQLARALGPASYILGQTSNRDAFQAKIRRAIARHPSFHMQSAALEETEAGKKRARAALYPQLSSLFRGDYVLARDFGANTDNVVESLRPREQFTAGLSASQLVFDGGATFQRIKSARARHSEFKNALSTRINDLAFETLSVYYDTMAHQALVVLGESIVRRHEKILADVKERERLGAGAQADVIRAEARLAATQARVAEISESANLADIRFKTIFEEPATALVRPGIALLAVDSREEAVASAMRYNPELNVAAARAEASTADFKAAKGRRLPEVRVSVDAVKFDVFGGGDDYDVRAGVDVQYEIFGGGLRAADIAEAGSRARQAKFSEEQVRQEIAQNAAVAFERSNGARVRLEALKNAVIAHDKTRELVLEQYRVSRGDLIDVLQAENDYFDAAVGYVSGVANHDLAAFALMEHTGDLMRFFSPQDDPLLSPSDSGSPITIDGDADE